MDPVRHIGTAPPAAPTAGCLVIDASLAIRHWCDQVAEFAGLKGDEVIGQPITRVLPHLPAAWLQAFDDVQNHRQPQLLDGSGPFSHGTTHAVVIAFPVAIEGEAGEEQEPTIGIGLSVTDTRFQPPSMDEAEVPEIRSRLEELGMFEDPDFLRESLDEFTSNARALLRDLIGADGSDDPAAVIQAAHRLAGSSLTIGATSLGKLASAVESSAQGGVSPDLLDDLQVEATRVFTYCDSLRQP